MPTSALYDSTRQQLAAQLTEALASQIETLARIVVGIGQSVSAQIGKIARSMPLDTTQMAKEQRIRRLLDNARLNQAAHYHPIVRIALHGLQGQRVQIRMDRVVLRDIHNIFVVRVAFRRRSIPLAWIALPHRGQSGLADQQAVLSQACAALPPNVRVRIHADSEFRSQDVFAWLRTQGHDAMVGIPGHTLMALTPDGSATPLHTWLPQRDRVAYLNGVYLTENRQGPVNVLAWWDKDDDGKLIVRAVMTNLPASWQTYLRGRRRMWIETIVRDWQRGGVHRDDRGITDRDRFARLFLPMVIAYLWLVAVGRWVVKRGYRKLVDDGPARSWKYRLFQIGVAWKDRMNSYTQSIPVLLTLYL